MLLLDWSLLTSTPQSSTSAITPQGLPWLVITFKYIEPFYIVVYNCYFTNIWNHFIFSIFLKQFTTALIKLSFDNHHHHHNVVLPAWVYLTLSCHFSLSFITSGRSSELHPISSHSCCMYV